MLPLLSLGMRIVLLLLLPLLLVVVLVTTLLLPLVLLLWLLVVVFCYSLEIMSFFVSPIYYTRTRRRAVSCRSAHHICCHHIIHFPQTLTGSPSPRRPPLHPCAYPLARATMMVQVVARRVEAFEFCAAAFILLSVSPTEF